MVALGEVVVIIASVHRPVELGRWVDHIAGQTLKPVEMIWAVASDNDLPPEYHGQAGGPGLTIVRCPTGLTKQRNCGLSAISTTPRYIVFFDDDYLPTASCLADIVHSFEAMPDVVGLTGVMLGDGINSSGIGYEDAVVLIAEHERQKQPTSQPPDLELWDGLYGCNMAFRADVIADHQFDENLPLYAWQEDVDFAVRVAQGRKMGRTNGFAGVHQGIKGGRGSGKRLGYSQIVNPIYLLRKGSMKPRKTFSLVWRNIAANHVKSLKPEPWIDRRGRALGNWIAIRDVLRGIIDPTRILKL